MEKEETLLSGEINNKQKASLEALNEPYKY